MKIASRIFFRLIKLSTMFSFLVRDILDGICDADITTNYPLNISHKNEQTR